MRLIRSISSAFSASSNSYNLKKEQVYITENFSNQLRFRNIITSFLKYSWWLCAAHAVLNKKSTMFLSAFNRHVGVEQYPLLTLLSVAGQIDRQTNRHFSCYALIDRLHQTMIQGSRIRVRNNLSYHSNMALYTRDFVTTSTWTTVSAQSTRSRGGGIATGNKGKIQVWKSLSKRHYVKVVVIV